MFACALRFGGNRDQIGAARFIVRVRSALAPKSPDLLRGRLLSWLAPMPSIYVLRPLPCVRES